MKRYETKVVEISSYPDVMQSELNSYAKEGFEFKAFVPESYGHFRLTAVLQRELTEKESQ